MKSQMITLPEGVAIAEGELKKIAAALAALKKDPHAPRKLALEATLHVHNEYPKSVKVGETEDGEPIFKAANSSAHEADLLKGAAKEEPVKA
jgi:hypothetical protein